MIVYEPTVLVSTVPDEVTTADPELSVAVAPASVYAVPSSTVAGLSPSIVITGAKVSLSSSDRALSITAIPKTPNIASIIDISARIDGFAGVPESTLSSLESSFSSVGSSLQLPSSSMIAVPPKTPAQSSSSISSWAIKKSLLSRSSSTDNPSRFSLISARSSSVKAIVSILTNEYETRTNSDNNIFFIDIKLLKE